MDLKNWPLLYTSFFSPHFEKSHVESWTHKDKKPYPIEQDIYANWVMRQIIVYDPVENSTSEIILLSPPAHFLSPYGISMEICHVRWACEILNEAF